MLFVDVSIRGMCAIALIYIYTSAYCFTGICVVTLTFFISLALKMWRTH